MKNIFLFILALISSFVIGIGVFFLSYIIAVTISPPHIIINGEEHGTMPMGQVFISTMIAIVVGLFLLIAFYKYFKKKLS